MTATKPAVRRNIFAWSGLGLAIANLWFVGQVPPWAELRAFVVVGLIGAASLWLGVKALRSAEAGRRGRIASVLAIVLSSYAALVAHVGLVNWFHLEPEVSFVIYATEFGIVGLVYSLYLIDLALALKRCTPESRTMVPWKLWLLLIPIYNVIWQFFVVSSLARSIGSELKRRGLPKPDAMPGRWLGNAMCILFAIVHVDLIVWIGVVSGGFRGDYEGLSGFVVLLTIAMIDCWIIYWVKIAAYSEVLRSTSRADDVVVPPPLP